MTTKAELLAEFLKPYRSQEFETGVNDCALFISDWAKALTGLDLAVRFRGKYNSDLGSARLIKKLGYAGLEDLVCSEFDRIGKRRQKPMLAQRGDIVWVNGAKERLCGIVGATGILVLGIDGLITLPISKAAIAWEVDMVEAD